MNDVRERVQTCLLEQPPALGTPLSSWQTTTPAGAWWIAYRRDQLIRQTKRLT